MRTPEEEPLIALGWTDTQELYDKINSLAKAEYRSMAAYLRVAIRAYLESIDELPKSEKKK